MIGFSYVQQSNKIERKIKLWIWWLHLISNTIEYMIEFHNHRGSTPYNGLQYMGMLHPNGVPFWAPGMGKGSLFQAGDTWKGSLFRERYMKGVPSREKYVKGCQFLKISMSKYSKIWYVKGSQFVKLQYMRSIPVWNRSE